MHVYMGVNKKKLQNYFVSLSINREECVLIKPTFTMFLCL